MPLVANDFNPRAPCGARPGESEIPLFGYGISTHAPLAGRDDLVVAGSQTEGISTHAPLAGRDRNGEPVAWTTKISTHAPLAGRDGCWSHSCSFCYISTHAPLAGCDGREYDGQLCHFISTHAPLAGRDGRKCFLTLLINVFQPTRPLRGATQRPYRVKCRHIRFQPTRPLRGATNHNTDNIAMFRISTHAPLAGRDK
nr:MAG TPA: hypothetical protein [Caudoviricetes sp.]